MSRDQVLKLFSDTLPVTISDRGSGESFLLLHGGAGPYSMSGLAEEIAKRGRAVVPTHPGFSGQLRPAWFRRIDDLALAYLSALDCLDLRDVVLIGSSFGGWIAAEMALRRSSRVKSIILLNAVGIDAGAGNPPIVNPADLPPEVRSAYAFHDPKRFAAIPQTPKAIEGMIANQKASMAYAGEPFMHDPDLRSRLTEMPVPALLLWGISDRIVGLDYGRRFAASMPTSQFEVVADAGHFPHIEKLGLVISAIGAFTGAFSGTIS